MSCVNIITSCSAHRTLISLSPWKALDSTVMTDPSGTVCATWRPFSKNRAIVELLIRYLSRAIENSRGSRYGIDFSSCKVTSKIGCFLERFEHTTLSAVVHRRILPRYKVERDHSWKFFIFLKAGSVIWEEGRPYVALHRWLQPTRPIPASGEMGKLLDVAGIMAPKIPTLS